METKAIGYSLLIVGLVVIAFVGFNIFNILTGNARAINYFNFEPVSVELIPGQGEVEFLDAKTLNETSNLFGHIFLMGLIVTIGGKISSIGVELLRPVKINVRNEKERQNIQAK